MRLLGVQREDVACQVLAWLHRPEHAVHPVERVATVRADPADNAVLEAALAGQADLIVAADRHLRRLQAFRGIPILSARTAWRTRVDRAGLW